MSVGEPGPRGLRRANATITLNHLTDEIKLVEHHVSPVPNIFVMRHPKGQIWDQRVGIQNAYGNRYH
ncbi:hypothetical protein EYZ11_008787 [Aspergillus tanneri]|uniref:Uncharacterized protein n=1 Tax=Aspergillus tanneri TaxID=1220188 RepID=A0A4S3J9N1_9EURO|nr:hypothetical protein EYZ11_008787 [Aspergillus tanneri]